MTTKIKRCCHVKEKITYEYRRKSFVGDWVAALTDSLILIGFRAGDADYCPTCKVIYLEPSKKH